MWHMCVWGLNIVVFMESMKLGVIGKGCGCSVTKMKSVDLRVPLDLDLHFLDKARAHLNVILQMHVIIVL